MHDKKLSGLMVALLSVAWGHLCYAQNQPDISGEQLVAAAAAIKGLKPKDQFEAAPDAPDWRGRRFSYTVVPTGWSPESRTCSGLPEWTFRDGELTLSANHLFVDKFAFTGDFGGLRKGPNGEQVVDLNLYSIQCVQTSRKQVDAVTALGVHFPVAEWTDRAVGIFDTGKYDPKWREHWRTQIDGAVARELSRNLLVRISGVLQAWPNGRMVVCGSSDTAPRLDNPTHQIREVCGFNGRLDRIDFLNGSTGEVLYEMARKPSPTFTR